MQLLKGRESTWWLYIRLIFYVHVADLMIVINTQYDTWQQQNCLFPNILVSCLILALKQLESRPRYFHTKDFLYFSYRTDGFPYFHTMLSSICALLQSFKINLLYFTPVKNWYFLGAILSAKAVFLYEGETLQLQDFLKCWSVTPLMTARVQFLATVSNTEKTLPLSYASA